LPAKLDRCVSDVQDQGHDESSAFAICNDSIHEINISESHSPLDIVEGGPGSGRKTTNPHGKPLGQLPPAHTPQSKPSKPSSAITPMGRGKTSSSAGRVNETEEDICRECGKRREDHGMFTDHDFAEEPKELDEEDVDDLDENIKSITIKYKESFSVPGGLSAQSVGGKKIEEIEACPCFDSLHRALVQ